MEEFTARNDFLLSIVRDSFTQSLRNCTERIMLLRIISEDDVQARRKKGRTLNGPGRVSKWPPPAPLNTRTIWIA